MSTSYSCARKKNRSSHSPRSKFSYIRKPSIGGLLNKFAVYRFHGAVVHLTSGEYLKLSNNQKLEILRGGKPVLFDSDMSTFSIKEAGYLSIKHTV
jgi:hypothetical protein